VACLRHLTDDESYFKERVPMPWAHNECPSDLHGVKIYALGERGLIRLLESIAGIPATVFQVFRQSGADVRDYSILRRIPDFTELESTAGR
jgi:hypothetical protein